jgi:tetratricopeptide (TPR) repeat protein
MGTDLPKAEESLKKAMKPGCSAVLDFTLGGIQFQQDKVDSGARELPHAVTKFPSFRRAWRNLGSALRAQQTTSTKAIVSFVKMIELGGGDAYSYGMLGHSYASKEDFQPAEAAYRNALLLQPENTEWRLGLTRCAFKQKKFEDCAALLDVLIARYPTRPISGCCRRTRSSFEAAFEGRRELRSRRSPRQIDGRLAADAGGHLRRRKSHGAGRVGLLCARSTSIPTQPIARPMRAAEVLMSQGALREAGTVVEAHPDRHGFRARGERPRKLLKFEARLSMSNGESDEITAGVLEEMVRLDPLDGEALLLLGQHFVRKEQPDRAILYFERAENIEAFEVNARIRHAQVLVGMGRYADAVPLIRRAQEASAARRRGALSRTGRAHRQVSALMRSVRVERG